MSLLIRLVAAAGERLQFGQPVRVEHQGGGELPLSAVHQYFLTFQLGGERPCLGTA